MALVELPCGHTCAFLMDPLTNRRVEDPVVLPCGHTIGRNSIQLLPNKQQCYWGCQLPPAFEPIQNKAILIAIGELWEPTGKQQVFLSKNSLLPFHASFYAAYRSRQIHSLRTALITCLKGSSGVLFGSTPREYRRINQNFKACDGMPVSNDQIISAQTDVDIAFRDALACEAFLQQLRTQFDLSPKRNRSYQLQGLQVQSFVVWFLFHKGDRISLSLDVVYPDANIGLGCTWPDFVECQLACAMDQEQPRYVWNPLVDIETFFLPRTADALERQQDRYLRSVIRHIDDSKPWRWCLLRPEHFVRLIKTDRYLSGEAYELYVRSQLQRLSKCLYRGVLVQGISVRFCQTAKQFVLPCGHYQLTLHNLECFYDDDTDCLQYVCAMEKKKYELFREFSKNLK